MGLIDSIRRWIDGETTDDILEEAAEHERPRRQWEEFLVKIAREVEACMQREMFTPPGGPTYIPREYLVFLSREDDTQWQGDKREGLQRGLFHVLSERAKELVGDKEVQTKTFAVELRVDGTLEKGKFRVQPVWDTSAPKTEVRPRKKSETPPPITEVMETTVEDNEATIVRPRAPLFAVEYTLPGEATETAKFYQNKISIGRGSKDFRVDLRLEGDLEISRKQATLERRDDGSFTITCEGRNPLEIEGQEYPQGESQTVSAGQIFKIGKYELKIV